MRIILISCVIFINEQQFRKDKCHDVIIINIVSTLCHSCDSIIFILLFIIWTTNDFEWELTRNKFAFERYTVFMSHSHSYFHSSYVSGIVSFLSLNQFKHMHWYQKRGSLINVYSEIKMIENLSLRFTRNVLPRRTAGFISMDQL